MDIGEQIDFWHAEVIKTTAAAGTLFSEGKVEESREILRQTRTALARLRREAETSQLLEDAKYGAAMRKDLDRADAELQRLIKLTEPDFQ